MAKKHWLTGLGAGSLLLMGGLLAGPVAGFASNSNTTVPSAVVAQQDADDEQDPAYTGTIRVDDSVEMSEDQEAAALQDLATISQDEAAQAALATAPGASVAEIELDNENGWVVYSVELDNGTEVKVDAGNGQVLATEAEDAEHEADDGESGEEHEDENGQDADDVQEQD
jgi:uncharacterized membrane protein YkoI